MSEARSKIITADLVSDLIILSHIFLLVNRFIAKKSSECKKL
jgi:hypothetical protein